MAAFALVPALALSFGAPAWGQVPVESQTYRGFSVVNESDLEPALNRYAAEGYRLAALSPSSSGGIIAIMEQVPPGQPPREYRVVSGGWAHLRLVHNDVPILDLINQAGAQGFRFFPGSIVFINAPSAALVMEQDANPSAGYAYRLYSPELTTAHRFEQNALLGERDGFHIVFHGLAGRGTSTLMEKRVDGPAAAGQEPPADRFVSIARRDVVKSLQKQVDQGYLPAGNSLWLDLNGVQQSFWLRKASGSDLRLMRYEAAMPRQGVVPADFAEACTRQLNEAARQGYRLASSPVRVTYIKAAFRVHWVTSFCSVLQRSPGTPSVTYRYIPGAALPDLLARLNDAALEGFHIVPDSLADDGSVLMERVQPAASHGDTP